MCSKQVTLIREQVKIWLGPRSIYVTPCEARQRLPDSRLIRYRKDAQLNTVCGVVGTLAGCM